MNVIDVGKRVIGHVDESFSAPASTGIQARPCRSDLLIGIEALAVSGEVSG